MSNERDTLAGLIWKISQADEASISAMGANIISEAILASGYQCAAPTIVQCNSRIDGWSTCPQPDTCGNEKRTVLYNQEETK